MTRAMQWFWAGFVAFALAAPRADAQRLEASHAVAGGGADAGATLTPVAQVKDDLLAGTERFAQGATDVTEVNLDPQMLGMISGKNSTIAGMAQKMDFIVVHSYTYDKPGMYRDDDVEAYRKKLSDGSWVCGIHVRDKSGTTDICTRAAADHESTEMVILAAEPQELTFIHMKGRISLDDMAKMGGSAGGLKTR
jgi:Domain of unknown function (DUF4252)